MHRTRSLLVALALVLAAPAAARAADSPPLTVTTLTGTGAANVSASCSPTTYPTTFRWAARGTAAGPYAGTYAESGTITTDALRRVVALESEFTIDSPRGVVHGRRTLNPASSPSVSLCGADFGTVTLPSVFYEAALPDGRVDRGTGNVFVHVLARGLGATHSAQFTSTGVSGPPADTTPPSLGVPGDLVAEATGPDGAAVGFSVSSSEGSAVCEPASGSTFPLGATGVRCTATDAAGNRGEASFTVTVVDTTPPALDVPDRVGADAPGLAGARVEFAATATDAVDPSPDVACGPASGSTFPLGETQVVCTAADASGNRASAAFVVAVALRDVEPPVLTLPGAVAAEAAGPAGAAVAYEASAADVIDPSPRLECAPASGAVFALGTTTVSCTATDAAGNAATGSFTVTVRDTTPPDLVTPPSGSVDVFSDAVTLGATGFVVAWSASATDRVDGPVPVTCVPPPGAELGPGATTVTCTAVDAAGNRAERSFVLSLPSAVEAFDRLVVAARATLGVAFVLVERQLAAVRALLVRAQERAMPQLLAAARAQLVALAGRLGQSPLTRGLFAETIRWIERQAGIVGAQLWADARALLRAVAEALRACEACSAVVQTLAQVEEALVQGAVDGALDHLGRLERLVRGHLRRGVLARPVALTALAAIDALEGSLRALAEEPR